MLSRCSGIYTHLNIRYYHLLSVTIRYCPLLPPPHYLDDPHEGGDQQDEENEEGNDPQQRLQHLEERYYQLLSLCLAIAPQ